MTIKKKSLQLLLWALFVVSMQLSAWGQTITLPPEAGSITFTDPVQEDNMFMVAEVNPAAEAYTEAAIIDGTPCRRIPAGKFMYIGCDRIAVPTAETDLLIAVTYYGNSANNIWFNYNSTTNDYQGADFQKVSNDQWVTTIITVTDAALNGLMNGGSDFRMGFNGEDNYIRDISVHIGALDPDAQPIPASPGNPSSVFQDKSFAGYQIWHRAGHNPADWVHWSYGNIPAPGSHVNVHVASFPDLSEYPDSVLYPTNLGDLGNGRPAGLYNSSDKVIIDRQMEWLETAGLDGVAVQRFVGPIGRNVTITEESHLTHVKNAAEATGRLFYLCYDLNGSDANITDRLKIDWVYEIEQIRALTSSPNYATVDGKPVVEMWGVGHEHATAAQCAEMTSFLQSRGCYVIGGTPREWCTDPRPGFAPVFTALDAISPWTVGAYKDIDGANNYLTDFMVDDKAYCDANGMDYLPVVFAGSANWLAADGSFSETDRLGGRLLWQQILNAKSIGLTAVYYAMLDEFEENTNLIHGAVDYFDIPVDQYFETLSKDGIWTSSDYYLRLAARGGRTLRDEIPLSTEIEIPYSNGPVYFRNSFESRHTTFTMNGTTADRTMKIDPCFYNPGVISSEGVNAPSVEIVNDPFYARSGDYSARVTGAPVSGTAASHYYRMSETKIEVVPGMRLHFWKYADNSLGQYTAVDLIFQSGKKLSELPDYTDNNDDPMTPAVARGAVGVWEHFACQIGAGELIGDTIVGISIGYDHPSATGNYTAYFDDVIIDIAGDPMPVTFISVHATRQKGGDVQVNWHVADEISMKYYEVERSEDGVHFTTIQVVDASGLSAYTVTDTDAPSGMAYYRIKGVGLDDELDYSMITSVGPLGDWVAVVLYPNPFDDQLTIGSNLSGDILILIHDLTGKTVYRSGKSVESGEKIHIRPDLPAGMYVLTVQAGDYAEHHKIIRR